MQYEIKQGMNQDILKQFPDNHFDSIVTDPPYGIEFLGKDWDSNTGTVETWQECLRVLKPGGHLLAFSAARTYHHLATNIESVGFEIRDQIMWIYASGFPKAQDIGKAIQKRQGVEQTKEYKENIPRVGGTGTTDAFEMCKEETVCTSPEAQQWAGWKTALKPAHEPIVMARKPFNGSTIDNVITHGVGALNIDATRIGDEIMPIGAHDQTGCLFNPNKTSAFAEETNQGRFPSNVMGDIPEYQKYFYCPKVSRKERHTGFEQKNIPTTSGGMFDNHGTGVMYSIGTDMKTTVDPLGHIPAPFGNVKGAYVDGKRMAAVHQDLQKGSLDHIPNTREMLEEIGGYYCDKDGNPTTPDQHTNLAYIPNRGIIQANGVTTAYEQLAPNSNVGNNHPTVKPVELMKYLIKLVTPPNSKVLDPFCGSGSTGMAAVELGHTFIGCELDPAYVDIANKRIHSWNDHGLGPLFE